MRNQKAQRLSGSVEARAAAAGLVEGLGVDDGDAALT
jgi:hypothetical protein